MRKILIVLPNLNGGGAEKVAVNIANSLVKDGFNVSFLIVQNRGVYFSDLRSEVSLTRLDYPKVIYSVFGVVRVIRDLNPDIVFSTTHRMNFVVYLCRYFITKRIKLIFRLPNSPLKEIENNTIKKTQLSAFGLAYRGCYRVISQTDEMGADACNVFGLNSSKIITLKNPVNKDSIDSHLQAGKSPFAKGTINFVAAGRLHRQKGFDVLISAFARAVGSKPDYVLYIIGNDVGEGANLEKLIAKYELHDRVHLVGFSSNPYVYFKYCDLYILSSRWEGMPNTVLECCYIGCRVVCTRCVPVFESMFPSESLVDIEDIEQLTERLVNYTKVPFGKDESENDWNKFFDSILRI